MPFIGCRGKCLKSILAKLVLTERNCQPRINPRILLPGCIIHQYFKCLRLWIIALKADGLGIGAPARLQIIGQGCDGLAFELLLEMKVRSEFKGILSFALAHVLIKSANEAFL